MRRNGLVYLAGPDVFLPDPQGAAQIRKGICAESGLVGVSPLDDLPDEPPEWATLPLAKRIACRNEAHIRRCDAVIANLTPFRGPSADAGTVYEVGFARALGRPVFGFSNLAAAYEERVRDWSATSGGAPDRDPDRDRDGMEIESFGLNENLMVACGVELSGGVIVAQDCPAEEIWTNLAAFRRCVALVARSVRVD